VLPLVAQIRPIGFSVKQVPRQVKLPVAVAASLLVLRGVLLWLAVPLALVPWPAAWPFLRRRSVPFAQFLGWVYLNLVAGIERCVLRPLIHSPLFRRRR
jgi:hypothetical protein